MSCSPPDASFPITPQTLEGKPSPADARSLARSRDLALARTAAEAMRAEILRRCRVLFFPDPQDAGDRLLVRMGEQTRDRLIAEILRVEIEFRLPE